MCYQLFLMVYTLKNPGRRFYSDSDNSVFRSRAVLYSVTPSSDEQVGYLRMLEKTNEAMDFWVLTSWTGKKRDLAISKSE